MCCSMLFVAVLAVLERLRALQDLNIMLSALSCLWCEQGGQGARGRMQGGGWGQINRIKYNVLHCTRMQAI